jgi:hypothetical protein
MNTATTTTDANIIQKKQHALLAPSSAERWLHCTPSAREEEKYAEEDSSESSLYAQEGTLAHELGCNLIAYTLKFGANSTIADVEPFINNIEDIKKNHLYNKEMLDYMQAYRDFVIEKYNEMRSKTKDAVLFLEQRLDFSLYVNGGFGTGDSIIIGDGNIEIIDLKYGQGIKVEAKENKQMMLYALGAYTAYSYIYDIKSVTMTIYQPRINNYSSWNIEMSELLKWGNNELRPKAILAYEGLGNYEAGKHCHFCKARNRCKEYANYCLEVMKEPLQQANELKDKDIINILQKADIIKKWLSSIEEYALNEALKGKKWQGYKLVEGRSNRVFTDNDKVVDTLTKAGIAEALLYDKKLKTITTLEKDIGKKRINELVGSLIIKPQGKPTLATEDDKREEWKKASAEDDFKDININELKK